MNNEAVQVWCLPTRVFHWSLVSAFTIAWFTEGEWAALHEAAGYTVLGLLSFRLLWGLIGPKHARFTDFVRSPATVKEYIKDVLNFRAKRYLGHNPAGGAMVLALMFSLLMTASSGILMLGYETGEGPAASWIWLTQGPFGWLAELHELFANLSIFLVVGHVIGVLLASLQHHENLVNAMFTGFKHRQD